MSTISTIKVCPDPCCEAVYHNCPLKATKCKDCGGNIMKINEATYRKKFSLNFFQYDYNTGAYLRPTELNTQKVYEAKNNLELPAEIINEVKRLKLEEISHSAPL